MSPTLDDVNCGLYVVVVVVVACTYGKHSPGDELLV